MIGLVGQKCGMTRVFTPEGESIPVTVVFVDPNRIVKINRTDKEGYNAIQVTMGHRARKHVNKPIAGHYAKAKVEPGKGLWEFYLETPDLLNDLNVGTELRVDRFQEGQWVDVTGTSKGKGFAGTVKRHNFRMQDATHGNSLSHRAPGSIGQNQSPGRVFKGKKMAGQMGNVRCTIQSLKIIRIDQDRNLLLIKGCVPGAPGGVVLVKPSVKKLIKEQETE